MEFDSSEIDNASATAKEQEKAYAEEVARVWYPFGKVCLAFLEVVPYKKKIHLTKELVFFSDCAYKHIYRFDLFYKRKPILRVSVETAQGFITKPMGFGLLYRGSKNDFDPLEAPFVDKSVFFFEGAYVEQIQEAFEIMKSRAKAHKDKRTQVADTSQAFHQLTFTEHTMKLTDAIATLDILEESLDLLSEMKLQELDLSKAAEVVARQIAKRQDMDPNQSNEEILKLLRSPAFIDWRQLTAKDTHGNSQRITDYQALRNALEDLQVPQEIATLLIDGFEEYKQNNYQSNGMNPYSGRVGPAPRLGQALQNALPRNA